MDWYSMSAADAVGKLGSSVDRGLSSHEAEKRLGQDGENILRGKKKWQISCQTVSLTIVRKVLEKTMSSYTSPFCVKSK